MLTWTATWKGFRMGKVVIFSLLCFLFATGSALAYRPFNTEDAGVAGKGVVQTEISYDYYRWENGDTDQIFLLVSPIYGPTENLELSIETPLIIHTADGRRSSGIGDINLVGKYVLLWDRYETKDALLTLKGVVKLNSGDYARGLGRGDVEYSLFPVVTKTLGEKVTVHGQLGYAIVTAKENPDLRNYYFYGTAVDVAITKPFHLVAEITGNQNPDRTQGQQNISLAGFTYELNKHVILDASVKKGIGNASPDWGWGVGAAIEF